MYGYTIMTLAHATNSQPYAANLPCQLDTVNIDMILNSRGAIPTDSYDLYSVNWTLPVPGRSDYFIDQATHIKYQVFGNVAVYPDHLEMRVTKYTGSTP